MGTPNRLRQLNAILGGRKTVKASELTLAQWGKIAGAALRAAKPRLSHMVGFEELANRFTGPVDDSAFVRRFHDQESDMGPTGLEYSPHGDGTLCITLAVMSEDRWVDKEKARFTGQFVHRTELLLTRGGRVLFWNWNAELKMVDIGFGRYFQDPGTYEVATWSRFTCPGRRQLEEQTFTLPGVGQQVLRRLHLVARETLKKREEQLQLTKNIDELLDIDQYIEPDET